MSTKVLELPDAFRQDDEARWIAHFWDKYNSQRREWLTEKSELRNYLFATDTSTTTNQSLPWKNSTTLPKLCQIRDNLHSNYLQAMFPNEDWLRWEGYTGEDDNRQKAKTIQGYMANKARESGLRTEVSKLLYDYIDYGNAYATVDYESRSTVDLDGSEIPGYIGPVLRRISPEDIVFNPIAADFKYTPKVVRAIKTWGELLQMSEDEPDNRYLADALEKRKEMRKHAGGWSTEDFNKTIGYEVDGFGSYQEYLGSDYVEVLEFFGDYYNPDTNELSRDKVITIIDRVSVIRIADIPSWLGHAPIYHVGWRTRPDNLYAMGPLDNLVGMQYRIDHLENLKADAMDLSVHPPVFVQGEVEEFVWAPGSEIIGDENASVQELGKNLGPLIAANNEIQLLEDKMELYAGAPREAMGVRSPGEKTALEVNTLSNASQRIFQEKTSTFELMLLEPSLNAMLEKARRNMNARDVVRVLDEDLGVADFMEITKSDITASGKLRPVGARHFGEQAQLLQSLIQISNSNLYQSVAPHISGKSLALVLEDTLGVERHDIFSPNAAVFEQQETQRLLNQTQEDLEVEQSLPVEGAI